MEFESFSLALETPLETARGPIESRDGFLIRIDGDDSECDGGHRGVGEATPLPGWTESLADCEAALADYQAALADCRAALTDRRAASGNASEIDCLNPRETPAAAHGVDLALRDRRARRDGVPLTANLGDDQAATSSGVHHERIPVNETLGDADPDSTREAAHSAVDAGFETLKLKVGAGRIDRDIRRVRAAREAVGADISVRVDANGAWAPEEAERVLERLVQFDVEYVEQPVPADRVDALGALDSTVDVAADESVQAAGPQATLDSGVDVIVLKPMALGGVGRARSVAADALTAGVDPVVTTAIDGAVARTGAVHLAASIPDVRACGLATGRLLAEDLDRAGLLDLNPNADPVPVVDGHVRVPDGPGLGVEFSGGER